MKEETQFIRIAKLDTGISAADETTETAFQSGTMTNLYLQENIWWEQYNPDIFLQETVAVVATKKQPLFSVPSVLGDIIISETGEYWEVIEILGKN